MKRGKDMGYNEYKALIKTLVTNIDNYTFSYDRDNDDEDYIADMIGKANKVIAVCEMAMRHPYANSNQIARLTDCERAMNECITALRNGETKFIRVASPISRFADEFDD